MLLSAVEGATVGLYKAGAGEDGDSGGAENRMDTGDSPTLEEAIATEANGSSTLAVCTWDNM